MWILEWEEGGEETAGILLLQERVLSQQSKHEPPRPPSHLFFQIARASTFIFLFSWFSVTMLLNLIHEGRGRGEEGKRGRGEEGKRGRGEEGKRGRGQEGERGRGEEGRGKHLPHQLSTTRTTAYVIRLTSVLNGLPCVLIWVRYWKRGEKRGVKEGRKEERRGEGRGGEGRERRGEERRGEETREERRKQE